MTLERHGQNIPVLMALRTRRRALALAGVLTALLIPGVETAPRAVHEPVRLSRGGITVIGNAAPDELARLAEAASDARMALEAMAPHTASIVFPLIFFTDCGDQSVKPGIYEQRWGLYVVLRCATQLDGREGSEQHARLLLQQANRGLPLWLEVGSARLAASARRATGDGIVVGHVAADDLASHRVRPLPAVDVFAAGRTTSAWTDTSLQGQFVRQSYVYTRHLATAGSLGTCLAWPAETLEPETQLRRCLRTDIDAFHAVAMERWAEGSSPVALTSGTSVAPVSKVRLEDDVFNASRLDSLLAANASKVARKQARVWGFAEPRGAEAMAVAGRLKLASGDASGAASDFERSLATRFDPMVAYHYASALVGPAVRADSLPAITTSDAAQAEALLRRVVEVFPLADAMALLGIARLRTGDAGGAVQSLSDAVHAWPRHEYALWMARALASGRRVAAARRTAAPLQEIGETDTIRKRAREFVRQLPDEDGDTGPVPVLPPLGSGEQRDQGRLLNIECRADWTELTVEQQDGRLVRFVTARLGVTKFMFFGTEPAPLRCGRRETPEHVVVTWTADARTPAGSQGIIVSVTFLAGPNGQL